MKKVCYTVITNEYDSLKEPVVVSDGWRYVCFTDNPALKSDVWEIVPYTEHNRRVKILGHKYFNGVTVYVDASFRIKLSLDFLLHTVPTEFSIIKHPKRNCIYAELDELMRRGKVDVQTGTDQRERYKQDFFPVGNGLGANYILIRDFRLNKVREVCEMWWKEFQMGVQRDQVSLSYCLWKVGMVPYYINKAINNTHFQKNKHS